MNAIATSKWPMVALGDVLSLIRNGKSVSNSKSGGGVPITRIETISDGTINPEKAGFANLKLDGNEKWLVEVGDILFSHINSVEHIGKTAIYCGTPEKLLHGMNLLLLRPNPLVLDPNYAKRALSAPQFRTALLSFVNKAVNQASISISNLKTVEIPLPPLDEQKRIAAILDKADALRRKRRDALALLDTLTQSIFVEMFGDPNTNPKNLVRRPLSELIKVSSGEGLTSKDMLGDKFPVYGGNGINGWHNQGEHPAGTVVIGRVGVYCGAVHVTDRKSWITDNALVVKKKQDIETEYLADALKLANLNQYAGRAAQPLVSGNRIYPVEILVPDEAEQRKYSELKRNLESRSQKIVYHLSHLDDLFASLQSRAFSGEL